MLWAKETFYTFLGAESIHYGNSEGKTNKKNASLHGVIVCLFAKDFTKL